MEFIPTLEDLNTPAGSYEESTNAGYQPARIPINKITPIKASINLIFNKIDNERAFPIRFPKSGKLTYTSKMDRITEIINTRMDSAIYCFAI